MEEYVSHQSALTSGVCYRNDYDYDNDHGMTIKHEGQLEVA